MTQGLSGFKPPRGGLLYIVSQKTLLPPLPKTWMDVCLIEEALCNVGSPLKRGPPGEEGEDDDENYPTQRPRIGGGAGGDPTHDGQDALAAVIRSERPEWFGAAH